MKLLFDKLSSYSVLGRIFCGAVFAVLADKFLNYSLIQQNVVTGICFYYFLGLIISKIGLLIVEPFLKKISVLRCANNQDLLSAAEKDEKFEILLKMSSIYRSLGALFLLILFLKLYDALCNFFPVLMEWSSLLLILFLLFSFLIFFIKKITYVTKTVETKK